MGISASEVILEYVFPSLGIIIGNSMFAAPLRACYRRVVEGRGLQSLNPTPWAFMLGNCFGWVTYSVLKQNLWLFFGNAPGFCMSVWLNLQACKLQYEAFRSNELRKSIVQEIETGTATARHNQSKIIERQASSITTTTTTTTEAVSAEETARLVSRVVPVEKLGPASQDVLVLLNVVVWLALASMISFTSSTFSNDTKLFIVGIACNLNLVFYYAAPLSIIWTVLRMRSSESIHVPTMLLNTLNGLFWGAYGMAIGDFLFAVPNFVGATLGAVQIVLCVLFPRGGNQDKNNSSSSENKKVANGAATSSAVVVDAAV